MVDINCMGLIQELLEKLLIATVANGQVSLEMEGQSVFSRPQIREQAFDGNCN